MLLLARALTVLSVNTKSHELPSNRFDLTLGSSRQWPFLGKQNLLRKAINHKPFATMAYTITSIILRLKEVCHTTSIQEN